VFREGLRPPSPFREAHPFDEARTQDGMSLRTLSAMSPVVVVCLGIKGARGMLRDVAAARAAVEAKGARIALVHTGDDALAAKAFEPFDLHYLARIADPGHKVHGALGLTEAPQGLLRRPRMQAGAFLLVQGEVRAGGPGERHDYVALAGS
jgi:hypothetical protein